MISSANPRRSPPTKGAANGRTEPLDTTEPENHSGQTSSATPPTRWTARYANRASKTKADRIMKEPPPEKAMIDNDGRLIGYAGKDGMRYVDILPASVAYVPVDNILLAATPMPDRTDAEIHAARSHGIMIKCGECGYQSGMTAFCETDSGDLPPTDYQCPNCRVTIRKTRRPDRYASPPCAIEVINQPERTS